MAKLPTDAEVSAATAAFEPYFAAVGRVVHAWNHLQEQLGAVFCEVAELNHATGMAIWHANANDQAQRRMLEEAAKVSDNEKLVRFKPARDDLEWLLEAVTNIAKRRNDAVHAPCTLGLDNQDEFEIQPGFGLNPRAQKLRGTQVLEEFEWCAKSADMLRAFARAIDAALVLEGYPWPDRPSLPVPPPRQTAGNRTRQTSPE